ncbi:GNAT family N-acetyltransferase [Lactobacillaceae bacterium L1_55_11]|nr:GNAT family N-acetyltransferase [Lactobacillaceae bacterium L1_55_11]
MQFEPARSTDQTAILDLEQTILDDMDVPAYQVIGKQATQAAVREASLIDPDSHYGYRHALVARHDDGTVVGVAFGYPAQYEVELDQTLQAIVAARYDYHDWVFPDREGQGEEWYLDSIVVSDQARGQGVGGQLLNYAAQAAGQAGFKTIGLNVDDLNPRAKKLYLAQGFEFDKKVQIGSHSYSHLQRKL